MTDLERHALLGDREAQEECTEKGIVLPCPFCGRRPNIMEYPRCGGLTPLYGVLRICGMERYNRKEQALESWNTRAAPPIGRCGTCRWAGENIEHPSDPHIFCDQFERILLRDDFCSLYEPKEADEK